MDIKTLLITTHKALASEQIDHALIGGLALGALGIQRFTNDVDLLVDGHDRDRVKQHFYRRGYSLFFESPDILQFEGEGCVDFLLANRDLSRGMLKSAKPIPGIEIKCLGPEDIIGLKIQAYTNNPKRSFRDKADIQSLIEVHKQLDWLKIQTYAELFGEWENVQSIRKLIDESD